jgi:hypothetical protein
MLSSSRCSGLDLLVPTFGRNKGQKKAGHGDVDASALILLSLCLGKMQGELETACPPKDLIHLTGHPFSLPTSMQKSLYCGIHKNDKI